MRIHKVLETIFGSPARINILRVLVNSPQPLSGRQVGELSGLTHRGAIQALKSLVDLGAVRQRKVGKAYQYYLLKDNIFVERFIIPCIKTEAGLFDELKRDLTGHFGKDVISLILYGSLVRSEERKGSDIDLMAIIKNESKKLKLEEKATFMATYYTERFNSLLSLHCYTLNEIKDKKTLPLINSVKKEGILLSGKPLQELLK